MSQVESFHVIASRSLAVSPLGTLKIYLRKVLLSPLSASKTKESQKTHS
jgi:hypothetical protein